MKITAATIAVFGALFLSTAVPASAAVITFDSLGGDDSTIANGYAGLSWSNFSSISDTYFADTYGITGTGFDVAAVSGTNFATNDNGDPASFSLAKGTFKFTSAAFTSAFDANQVITVSGLLNGTQVYSKTFSVSDTGPTLESFNWAGINDVVVSPIDNGNGAVIGVDDVNVSAVPLPAGLPLFVSAMAGRFAVAGNRARKA